MKKVMLLAASVFLCVSLMPTASLQADEMIAAGQNLYERNKSYSKEKKQKKVTTKVDTAKASAAKKEESKKETIEPTEESTEETAADPEIKTEEAV